MVSHRSRSISGRTRRKLKRRRTSAMAARTKRNDEVERSESVDLHRHQVTPMILVRAANPKRVPRRTKTTAIITMPRIQFEYRCATFSPKAENRRRTTANGRWWRAHQSQFHHRLLRFLAILLKTRKKTSKFLGNGAPSIQSFRKKRRICLRS